LVAWYSVCASFDKTAYRSSEIIKLTISITNTGTGTALQVFMDAPLGGPGYRMLNPESGIFGGPGAAVNIPAGQTYSFEQDGYAADPASGTVTYSGEVVQGTGQVLRSYPDPVNISASVTPVTGSYGGTVFADDNANGQQDPGEHGLPGVKVTLNGPFGGLGTSTGGTDFPATTDAQGHFQLDNLAGGQYIVQVTGVPDGSVVHPPSNQGIVLVDGSPGQTSELYPVVPQLSNTLHASMSFDQSSYHVGQSAHLTVTLQNTGTTPITGIQAGCDHVGDANQVMGLGNGWEVLRGAGVTVNPGQTTTLHLSELVMADSGAEGMFFAECVFGPDAINGDFTGYPDPNASVKALPALTGTSTVALKLIDDDPVGPVVQAGYRSWATGNAPQAKPASCTTPPTSKTASGPCTYYRHRPPTPTHRAPHHDNNNPAKHHHHHTSHRQRRRRHNHNRRRPTPTVHRRLQRNRLHDRSPDPAGRRHSSDPVHQAPQGNPLTHQKPLARAHTHGPAAKEPKPVETKGIEPSTPALQRRCSAN
jgi:SdrD B-like protein